MVRLCAGKESDACGQDAPQKTYWKESIYIATEKGWTDHGPHHDGRTRTGEN